MARLVLCALALLVASGLADPVKPVLHKPADKTVLEQQHKLLILFFHIHEPNHFKQHQEIEKTWSIEKNAQLYENATAVHRVCEILDNKWNLPKGVPFSVLQPIHRYEVEVIFNLLFSAKNFDTFYKTAVYLRPLLNEYLFVYVLSVAIYHRHDTQQIIVPPLYSIVPSFFFNSEVMTSAQRIAVHGKHFVEHYPNTYIWDENVVITQNQTVWPYVDEDVPLAYYTHDADLNNLYYSNHLAYPFWLGQETCPLIKDRRGELWWFWHKQLVARYYMERLSNGLPEIPVLDWSVVPQGYNPGLAYINGIAFPSRPAHFHLDAPWMTELLEELLSFENRITEIIAKGVIYSEDGKPVSIRSPDAIDLIGRVIESNVDSTNNKYYKDIVTMWKSLLGNSNAPVLMPKIYHNDVSPLVVPSALDNFQTALRDPAFYMIWKRILKLFQQFHESLPEYTHEELVVPAVEIEKVEVDKLVTYFEHTYINVTNHLHLNEFESEHVYDTKSVLVQRPRLNHKVFTIRVNVKSDNTKHVSVRFFLAPKYDSMGREIPLVENTQNFFQFDQMDYVLQAGENVITRVSNEMQWSGIDQYEGYELYKKVEDALNGGQFLFDAQRKVDAYPRRLLLPKGTVGGMPFVLMVYISEFKTPNVIYGTGFDPITSLGLASGARRVTMEPLGFPVDRPLNPWQVKSLKNIRFQDVIIQHKKTPEVVYFH